MNRIYRRIWNATRQCWVVASELAAARGKFSRAPQAALLMAVSISGSALANPLATDDTHEEDAVVIAPFQWYRASMGNELMFPAPLISQAGGAQLASSPSPRRMYALVTDTLAADSNISGDHMLVVGTRSSLIGNKSVGYGNLISSKGDHNTAVGFQVETQGGYATSVGATSRALEIGASAFGNNALAARVNTVALGSGARAQANNAVALGANSYANEVNTVSVGTSSEKRRIVNVEEGRLNALSTDAVTGGQLFQTNARVGSVESKARGFESHLARIDAKMSGTTVELGDSASASGEGSIAIGSRAASSGLYSMAAGINSRATSLNAVALGASSYATEMNALALGASTRATARDSIAIGFQAVAGHQGSVAIGRQSATSGNDQVSVGNATLKRKIVNVADGTVAAGSSDAVTGAQLHSVDVQVKAASNRIDATNLALGKGAVAESGSYGISTAIGNNAKAYNGRSVALGFDALAGVDAEGNRVTGQNAGVSIGANTRSANGAVATGFRAIASGNFSIAVGGDANAAAEHATAMGYLSKATAKQSTALGRGSEAKAQFATALGNLAVSANTSAVALGDRANARHDNAVALGAGAVTASVNSVSVGSATLKRKIQYIADGVVSNGSTDAITGSQLFATNQAVSTAQSTATSAQTAANAAKADAAKALTETTALAGLVSQTAATGNVRLGEKNSGTVLDVRNSANASRKVTGVADGTVSASSNEAVNGKQLNATNVQVAAVEKAATAAQADATAAKADAAKALVSTTALEGLVSQAAANGNVRLGEKNSGTVLDVRNSANASRKVTGVADGTVSASSNEAVNGKQLNATNVQVAAVEKAAAAAQADATVAKADAAKALVSTTALEGLVSQVAVNGNVRLGEKNSGTVLDVRNSGNANRRVSGLADGVLSDSSADAVSGRQLFETNGRVSSLESNSKFVSVGFDEFSRQADAGVLGVAIGDSAKTGRDGGTAVGAFSAALGINSVAIGRGSGVSAESSNGFAMGAGAQVYAGGGVAVGAGAAVEAGASGSVAIGLGSEATAADTVSFGNASNQRRLVNVDRGTADHNATTVSQLKDSLATLGGSAGMDANGSIIAPTYAVQGGTQNTVEDALMALDGAVITSSHRTDKVEGQLNSIFQDSPSARGDGMSQIALSGANGMVLTNLADGRVAPGSRDAVTGNQLYAAEQKISQNRNDLEAMRKEREMREGAMRGLDAGVIDYGGARLTGVAEGKLSADSSDVVRGSQLYETNSRVSAMEGISQYVSVGTAPGYGPAQAGPVGLAIGNFAKTGTNGGTAIGTFAHAMGINSVAIGRGSTVFEGSDYSFAIGTGAEVGRRDERGAFAAIALGVNSRVEPGADGSLALGSDSQAIEARVASFGNAGMKRRLVNIANGTANHNAASVGQLRGALSALGGEVDANGNIVGPSFTVQGQSQSTLNGALEALDGAVVSNRSRVNQVESQLRNVFQDAPSVRADGLNQLTLAGTHGMVISNVANGLVAAGSRDAVNGGQLHSMQQQLNGRIDGLEERIDAPQPRAMAVASAPEPEAPVPQAEGGQQVASVGEGEKPAPQPKSKQDDTPKPQVDTAELEKMLARANEYTDSAISNFERRLDKMDKRFNRMAAMSSAQTAMAMNTAGLATYNRLGAGVGYSEGESAMAVGYQRVLNEKGSATFSLNGAFTNSGGRSMGVGVGIGW
ncbi:ESPR-type extended signal peptide-containing protein [Stenotrophomonas sepilia]|uniref:ESPR-type extended signal peptide-containing protein n=1 Tax=Stenotrophomonas sepilia TaxID=2860290 RepID=UPI002E766597|nr:ESPR-type extended signal peptide-containing protein [Stenotrophomonas sepilia]